ncbi:MAG: F-box domain and ankyrin repeat protein [Labilithrix sp.]|nr:F-box domain and ankyrin repeat protein [Labilithrix sp.]
MPSPSPPVVASRPEEVLLANGFVPALGAAQVSQFLQACKDGLDDVVMAWLELGMPPNAGAGGVITSAALINAVEGGHASTVEILLDRGADIEVRDSSDDTALRTAVNWGHPDLARLLVARGADVEAVSKYDVSALADAIDSDNEEARALLLSLGADPSFVRNGSAPLRTAIQKDAWVVAALLDAGAPASLVLDDLGNTALHDAVGQESEEIVTLLLDRGAAVGARNVHGLTALDHALFLGNDAVVEALTARSGPPDAHQLARAGMWRLVKEAEHDEALAVLEANDISIASRDESGSTLLMALAGGGHLAGVERLLARGADPDEGTSRESALSRAIGNGHVDVAAALLAAGASPVDPKGAPAGLHAAIWEGHEEAARQILGACTPAQRAGAAPYVSSACRTENVEMVRILVEAGVPLDDPDDVTGTTPLMQASTMADPAFARLLIEGGADIHAGDSNGATALGTLVEHHGWAESMEPTLKLLLERGARLDGVNWQHYTPWERAVDDAKSVLVRELVTGPLEEGVSYEDLAKRHGWATLPMFLHADRKDALLAVIDAGVAIERPQGARGTSVLHAAIEAGDAELVRALLARGADVHRRCHWDWTPLMTAAGEPSLEILALILDAGGDPAVGSDDGTSCLARACPRVEHVAMLIARGAPVSGRTSSPLFSAAYHGSAELGALMLAHGARVDVVNTDGATPLLAAIEKGAEDLALLLLDAGASATVMGRASGETPLTAAAKKGQTRVVRRLLEAGGSLDDRNRAGEDVLTLILRRKQLRQAFADVLLAKGLDVSVPKVARLEPSLTTCNEAWAAVYRADVAAVTRAITGGELAVDERDAWGVTPLMVAVLLRSAPLVEALLELGADPLLEDGEKANASDYLSFAQDETITALLAARTPQASPESMMERLNARAARALLGQRIDRVIEGGELVTLAGLLRDRVVHPFLTADGRPFIMRALEDEDLLQLALDLGCSPDVVDGSGLSPLGTALHNGDLALAQRLLDGGARVDLPGLLVSAAESGEAATGWLLARAPGLIEARDARGRTPFMAAMEAWPMSREAASVLAAAGANVGAFDDAGESALHKAVAGWDEDATRFLLLHGADWNAVDLATEGAASARSLAGSMGMDAAWPEDAAVTPDEFACTTRLALAR